jgi:hypothetical protein
VREVVAAWGWVVVEEVTEEVVGEEVKVKEGRGWVELHRYEWVRKTARAEAV